MRIHDFLTYYAREQPEAECLVFRDRSVSYAEIAAETERVAAALIAGGVEPGERVAILAKNCPELILGYYGCFRAGVVPVPLNYRLAPREWAYIVNDAHAKLVVARGEYVEAIDAVRDEMPSVRRWIAVAADARDGWDDWPSWLGGAPPAPAREVDDAADAYQMYTSGTTGSPKGAILAHRAVTANLIQLTCRLHLARGERYLLVAPLYHAAAAVTAFWVVSRGGAMFVQEDFVPADAVRALAEDRITGALLVPAMIQACLVAVPDVAERRYDGLRFIVYGASPIAEETLRRALEVFQCDFGQGYGMTETTAALTFLSPADHRLALAERPELLLSAGRPLVGCEVRIVDEQDQPLPVGAIGEVVGRGPQLMRGYWNLPEASAQALRDGWMHTGDAGSLDAAGYLFIQDRVKDMIVSGGENVYPREVENVLYDHPAVADVAVIGVPDARWGEAVKAIVVAKPGATPSAEDLVAFCRDRLGGYKCPRSVDFADSLPRNPSGKVLKRELREPYWQGQSRRVS